MNSPLKKTLRELGDPDSIAHGVATTALTAGLTLINPRSLTPWQRCLYRTKVAGLSTWMIWAMLRNESGSMAPATRAGVTAATFGAVMGAAELSEAIDARMHDALVRRGVRRPRVLLSVAALVLGGVSWALGRSSSGRGFGNAGVGAGLKLDEHALDADEVSSVALPEDARAIAEALLKSTRKFTSLDLRAQLKEARAFLDYGPDGEVLPGVEFEVPDGVPLAVPGNGNFPVIGRFRGLGDRTFDVYLTLLDGKLTHLSVTEASDWSETEMIEWYDAGHSVYDLKGWPDPSELELLIETREGLSPIASS